MPARILERQSFDIPGGRHKLNPSQTMAVRQALKKQFAVIQGPPGGAHVRAAGAGRVAGAPLTPSLPAGTGKTVVGFHIVFWLHKFNEEQQLACGAPHGGPCLLYCGPSNKSVDVVAGAWGQLRRGSAWGRWTPGTVPDAPTAPRTAPEQEGGAEAPPCVQRAGRGHRLPGAGRGQQGPAQEDPAGGAAQPRAQVRLWPSGRLCVWVEASGLSCPSGPALGRGQRGASRRHLP